MSTEKLTCFCLLYFVSHLLAGVVQHNVKVVWLHPPQQGNLTTEVPVLAELLGGGHAEHSTGTEGAGKGMGTGQPTEELPPEQSNSSDSFPNRQQRNQEGSSDTDNYTSAG